MKKKIANQIAIPVLVVSILSIIILILTETTITRQILDNQLNEDIQKARKNYEGNYQRFINKAVQIAAIISSSSGTIEAFKKYNETGNLEESVEILKNDFNHTDKALKDVGYKKHRIHFHSKDHKSFYRSWTDKRGDDLSFRNALKECISDKKPILGIEAGRGGIAIRGIMPVVNDENQVLGSVENYVDIGELMKIFNNDTLMENYGMFIMPELLELMDKEITSKAGNRNQLVGNYLLLNATSGQFQAQLISEENMKQGLLGHHILKTKDYLFSFTPVPDYNGKSIGVIVYQYNLSQINQKSASLRVTFIAIGLGASLVLFLLISFLARQILTRPFLSIKEHVKNIAEGNMTSRIEKHSNNEIGEIIQDLEKMTHNLKEMVSNILSQSEMISQMSERMSRTSISISKGASDQASSIEEISSSMEEISSNMMQNSDHTKQTEQMANFSVKSANEGNRSALEMAASMKNIAEKIQIINDIAFQTNILALNAAVEAARAGEQGKGFAVVASEVRKLAERSKLASDDIANIIQTGVQSSKNVGDKLMEIVPQIEKTANLIQEIAIASREVSEGTVQINNAMMQLNEITQITASGADDMAQIASDLENQARLLENQVSVFKV